MTTSSEMSSEVKTTMATSPAVVHHSSPRTNHSKLEMNKQPEVHMFSSLKLNPMAKEFIPSSPSPIYQSGLNYAATPYYQIALRRDNEEFSYIGTNCRNVYNQNMMFIGARFPNNYTENGDRIRRTVYVTEIDHDVTEESLANLFSIHGRVNDCRICGESYTPLRFAFVEFANESSARIALRLSGAKVGISQIRVMPSKTAILPINSTFLPQTQEEMQKCAKTVCCTNIDKQVTQTQLKDFFETRCGEVSRLRLVRNIFHSTDIAFVEFARLESAVRALDFSGILLGHQLIRVNPSKTPLRF